MSILSRRTLGHRLPSTSTTTSNRQTTLPAPLRRLRRPSASPPRSQPAVAVQQRRPEPTRSSQICPEASSPTRRQTHETLASLAPHHISHTPLFTTSLSSPLLFLTPPPLPHLADHRNSNLASNKPRQPLTHGNPRVIAPLPLLTPACLHLSQSHYHPRLSRPRQSYSNTHTTSTSTCIQLAYHPAYCSILPSFSSTLAYAHIDTELPSLPDRPLSHASLHTTTPSISPYTQAVER